MRGRHLKINLIERLSPPHNHEVQRHRHDYNKNALRQAKKEKNDENMIKNGIRGLGGDTFQGGAEHNGGHTQTPVVELI